jgi:lipopolysaccharide export system protein LptA
LKFLVHILLLLLSFSTIAQNSKRIEILNADNTYANANIHPDYWRLIGNVSFKHNDAIMTCDSAYHYTAENKMKAFGKIKINQGDSITLTGEMLTYFGKENKADIKGDVVLIDKHMTLNTEQVFYNLSTNIASYPSKGTIIDNEKTINSKRGAYHSNIHKFIFKDSVVVLAKDYKILTDNMHYNSNSEVTYFFGPSFIISDTKTIYCENGWYNTKTDIAQFRENSYITTDNYLLKGDSLYYNKNKKYGKAFSNVELIDTVENMTVFGGIAEYFEVEEKVIISEKPMLELLFEEDTLFMHAKQFVSQQKIGDKKVLAYNNVKFFKTDFQGKCDSLSYNFSDSVVDMYDRPVLWSDGFQITADSLQFLVHKGEISRMFLNPNPMIIAQEDSLDYNQIKGKNMTAYFNDNKMRRMDIEGNGQSIFIVTDEETKDKIGLNYTECTDLILYFKESKLDAVNYEIKPNSVTTPYQDVEEKNRYLKGFNWRGSEQPKSKKDIFN